MARRTVFVSDLTGDEINGRSATLVVEFDDRRTTYRLDASEAEAMELAAKGRRVQRGPGKRGKNP